MITFCTTGTRRIISAPISFMAFIIPSRALKNAQQEYQLTPREKRHYKKHMWPLTISAMPMCREAWIVTMADKWCSLMETFHVHKGSRSVDREASGDEEEQKKKRGRIPRTGEIISG